MRTVALQAEIHISFCLLSIITPGLLQWYVQCKNVYDFWKERKNTDGSQYVGGLATGVFP